MDFVPDYKVAQKQIRQSGILNAYPFGTYSNAYIVTNEDLRKSMRFVPENCENALVVAASGDHPLFCSLSGAKHVDTFDISYNAKCIMDIKVAALNSLNYSEYGDFLDGLYMRRYNLHPITDINKMDEILYRLPKIESDYIHFLKDEGLFVCGPRPSTAGVLPTFMEYEKLRKTITQPYNFILSNIVNLSTSLTKSYDFIHLSNIFDYLIENDFKKLLLSIMKFVNPGGRIVMEAFEDDICFYLDFIGPKIVSMSDNRFVMKKMQRIHVFERIK